LLTLTLKPSLSKNKYNPPFTTLDLRKIAPPVSLIPLHILLTDPVEMRLELRDLFKWSVTQLRGAHLPLRHPETEILYPPTERGLDDKTLRMLTKGSTIYQDEEQNEENCA
jgi:hypothetical protein